MKFLDRQRLGIEAFLASRSSMFSRHNELDPDEFIARLKVQPYAVRSRVAQDVKSAITELGSGRYDTGSHVPPHIAALSDDRCSPERVGKMRPFFAWLQSIWRDNDQARTEWKSHLKAVADNLNTVSGECLLAIGMGYNNQRALLERKDNDTLELSLHERRWGRLSITFPSCGDISDDCISTLGFMYIIEGEVIENDRYRFSILFDTEFSVDDKTIRALRGSAWKQISFTCGAPQVKLDAINYAQAAEIRGASRLETIRYSSEVLCEKASLAGEAILSASERAALPAARLISATKILADKGKSGDIKSEDILIDLADNRYMFERITDIFEEEKAEPLCALMKKAAEKMEEENIDAALSTLRRLPCVMDELCSHGRLMPLLARLHKMMKKAGDCEESVSTRENVFRTAAGAFRAAIEPPLIKMGFDGEYPQYRRIRHGKAEYITAIIEREPEALDGNNLNYGFTVCASQVKMKRAERKAGMLRGIEFAKTYGTDFFNERPEYSNSGIVDCAIKNGFVQVSVNVLTKEASEPDCESINSTLRCVKRALRGFALRRKERLERKRNTDKKTRQKFFASAFVSAAVRYLPTSSIMCAVLAMLYLWGRTQFDVIADIGVRTAIVPIAFAGIITALLRALFYCLRRRRKLWIY